jgi:hypothetical protein
MELPERVYSDVLSMDIDAISSWRKNGGQTYHSVKDMEKFCCLFDLPIVPTISIVKGNNLPKTLEEADAFIKEKVTNTLVGLDKKV